MNFQLFIVPSGEINADSDKTEKSFLGLPARICRISDWSKINYLKADYEWFGIFYDNEHIDLELRGSIINFLNSVSVLNQFRPVSCALVYKRALGKDVVAFIGTTRLFHRSMFMGANYKPVCREGFMETEIIYGGFIVEHALCIRPSTDPKVVQRS